MEQIIRKDSYKNILYMIGGLCGMSLVIIVHECGHFLFAQLFGVPTPVFSLGFGPALFSLPIGSTIFQIAMIPFGGYVDMDPNVLAAQPYGHKILILFGGILFNVLFALFIFFYYSLRTNAAPTKQAIKELAIETAPTDHNHNKAIIIGPIGIISIIGKSLAISSRLFWSILAIISLNIAFFNLLPLPFFDGGKIVIATIENVANIHLSESVLWYITIPFLILFMFFMIQITSNDIKRLNNK
jgi:membrane-associated protease RseP (regulator of RpoE activity)